MLGERLRARRNELGFSQQQAAEMFHVSRQAISNWENNYNYPDVPTLIMISNSYQLSLDDMLKGDPPLIDQLEKDAERLRYLKKIKRRFGIIGAILFTRFGDRPRWGRGNYILLLFAGTFWVYMSVALLLVQLVIGYAFERQLTLHLPTILITVVGFGLFSPLYGWWAQDYLKK